MKPSALRLKAPLPAVLGLFSTVGNANSLLALGPSALQRRGWAA